MMSKASNKAGQNHELLFLLRVNVYIMFKDYIDYNT